MYDHRTGVCFFESTELARDLLGSKVSKRHAKTCHSCKKFRLENVNTKNGSKIFIAIIRKLFRKTVKRKKKINSYERCNLYREFDHRTCNNPMRHANKRTMRSSRAKNLDAIPGSSCSSSITIFLPPIKACKQTWPSASRYQHSTARKIYPAIRAQRNWRELMAITRRYVTRPKAGGGGARSSTEEEESWRGGGCSIASRCRGAKNRQRADEI